MRPPCIFCHQNGEQVATATHVAPQDNNNGTWDYVAVCDAHADGWWDGSDYPDGQGAPAIIAIDLSEDVHTTRLDEARQHMIDYLVESTMQSSAADIEWYVREYYEKLDPVDLAQEFRDTGGEDA